MHRLVAFDPHADDLTPASRSGYVRIIVELADPPVAAYRGSVPGLPATAPRALGRAKLNVNSSAAVRYRQFLDVRHTSLVQRVRGIAPDATISRRFATAINGVAMEVPAAALQRIANLPDVKTVYPDTLQKIDMFSSLNVIHAAEAWNSALIGGSTHAGEGIKIAVVDTGIYPSHPMFSPAGFAAPTPNAHWSDIGNGNYVCSAADPKGFCNNKIVLARSYDQDFVSSCAAESDTAPLGVHFHGTHTAATAAGEPVTPAGLQLPSPISGVAPRAWLMIYKALVADGTDCSGGAGSTAALLAALNDVLADGADIVSNSWGGGVSDPESSAFQTAIDNLTAAGTLVVFSAGNSGPGAGSVNCPGCVDSALTVAATTKASDLTGGVASFSGGASSLGNITGPMVTTGIGPVPIVDARVAPGYGDRYCRTPAAAGLFSGKIVLCFLGTTDPYQMGANVQAGGAVGIIAANTTARNIFPIPGISVSFLDGLNVRQWIQSGSGHTATLTNNGPVPIQQDVTASFSSRGPTVDGKKIKPDIAAPGVSILSANVNNAAANFPGLYIVASGTSMSAPHVSGAAALVLQANPSLTPEQLKSALMTTADQAGLTKENGTTAADFFDVGSGRLNAAAALTPTVTIGPYPSAVARMNAPGASLSVAGVITFSVTNVTSSTQNLTASAATFTPHSGSPSQIPQAAVEPANLMLGVGASAPVTITVLASAGSVGEFFGQLNLTSGAARVHAPIDLVLSNDFALSMQAGPPVLPLGSVVTYTVTLTNTNAAVRDFALEHAVPAGLNVITTSLTNGAAFDPATRTITWTGSLAGSGSNVFYTFTDSRTGGPSYALPDISGTGASLGCTYGGSTCWDDERSFSISPKSVSFFGAAQSAWTADTNGYVRASGSAAASEYEPGKLPDTTMPADIFAMFWRSLEIPSPSTTSGGWFQQVTSGIDPAAPTDEFLVVLYKNVHDYGIPSAKHTFAFVARIGTNKELCAVYGALSPVDTFTEVGLQDSTRTSGGSHYFNGLPLANAPANGVTICAFPRTAEPQTSSFTYAATAAQTGTITSTVSATSLYDHHTALASASITAALPPQATTTPATNVLTTTATLNGTVNPNGAPTTATFFYGTTPGGPYPNQVTAAQSPLSGGSASTVSANLAGLIPNTAYYFAVQATSAGGSVSGGEQQFMTPAAPPQATTNAATSVTTSTAALNGTVNPLNSSTAVTFSYGTTPGGPYPFSAVAAQSPLTGATPRPVSAVISGLAEGTTYYYVVTATNIAGTTGGGEQHFIAQSPPSPTPTSTPPPTPTRTPEPSATPSPAPSATPGPSATPTQTASPAPTTSTTVIPLASVTKTVPSIAATGTPTGTATPATGLTPGALQTATPTATPAKQGSASLAVRTMISAVFNNTALDEAFAGP